MLYSQMARESFLKTAAPLVVVTFLGVYNLTPSNAMMTKQEQQMREQSVYYAGCNEVRALGKDPLYRGDPGYRPGMDGDDDGIACEPLRY
jgi:hypothetical protein